MADIPAAVDKGTVAPQPAEASGKGADNKTETAKSDKGLKERTKSWVSKLNVFKSSGNPEGGLRDIAAAKPEKNDAKAGVTDTSARESQADTDQSAKPTPEAFVPSDPKGEKSADEDADLQDKIQPSDWEEYKSRVAKIAEPSRRFAGLLRPSAKDQARYTNAKQDLKQEYIEKHATAKADQDAKAASAEGPVAGTTAVPSGETTQPKAESPQTTEGQADAQIGPQTEYQQKVADLRQKLDNKEITYDQYVTEATALLGDSLKDDEQAKGELPDADKPQTTDDTITTEDFARETGEAPTQEPSADERAKNAPENTSAETPSVDRSTLSDAQRERLEHSEQLVKDAKESPGAKAEMEKQISELVSRHQDPSSREELMKAAGYGDPIATEVLQRLSDLDALDAEIKDPQANTPSENTPETTADTTSPATPEDILTKAGITPEQLADVLNSPNGEALAQTMQENPEQAQAILQEIAKAREMQTQLKALCETNGWPFDAKQGMEFALGRIAAQLGNEMTSGDAAGAEDSRKRWTILKVLLLTLGIPLVIAAAAVAAEASLITAGTQMARQAA